MSDFWGPLISGGASLVGAIGGITLGAIEQNDNRYFNEQNLALAKEAQAAQLKQQDWANEQYIENRDYSRALQERIFEREDTAMQRAVDDYTAAGFSPLAALGQSAGAGAVVSQPALPSSSVGGNQAHFTPGSSSSLQNAFSHLADSGHRIGAMMMTRLENQKQRDHQSAMQTIQLASEFRKQGNEHMHSLLMQSLEQDWKEQQQAREFAQELSVLESSQNLQRELQRSLQAHQSSMQEDAQQHAKDMVDLDMDNLSAREDPTVRAISTNFEASIETLKKSKNPVIKSLAEKAEKNPIYKQALLDTIRGFNHQTEGLVDAIGDILPF